MAIIKHKLTQCSVFSLNFVRQKAVDAPLCLILLHLSLETWIPLCHPADLSYVYFLCTEYDIIWGKKVLGTPSWLCCEPHDMVFWVVASRSTSDIDTALGYFALDFDPNSSCVLTLKSLSLQFMDGLATLFTVWKTRNRKYWAICLHPALRKLKVRFWTCCSGLEALDFESLWWLPASTCHLFSHTKISCIRSIEFYCFPHRETKGIIPTI